MSRITRRRFIQDSALMTLVGGNILVAPQIQSAVRAEEDQESSSGHEVVRIVPFVGERRLPPSRAYGSGLDGRLVYDLQKVDKEHLVTPSDEFFVRTQFPDGLDLSKHGPWTIRIHGLVKEPVDLKLTEVLPWVQPKGVHVLECSGNTRSSQFGLLSAASWSGVAVTEVLKKVATEVTATRVLISGFDVHSRRSRRSWPGASWVFTFDQLSSAGAFLATEMNGEPLPRDHGFPVRLIVPGWYGCTCAKWVNEIKLVDDSEPATLQMKEFATRTHQVGFPELAKDFRPAAMDLAAMPVRVEKLRSAGRPRYRVVGILWGGEQLTDKLMIRFHPRGPYVPVESYKHQTNRTWTLWRHTWQPDAPGRYHIQLKVDDPTIATRRLDRGYYVRSVEIRDA